MSLGGWGGWSVFVISIDYLCVLFVFYLLGGILGDFFLGIWGALFGRLLFEASILLAQTSDLRCLWPLLTLKAMGRP